MISRAIALLAAALIVGVVASSGAQSAEKAGRVYTSISPAELEATLSELGFATSRYTQRSDDTPELIGAVDGLNYSILFYRCDRSEGPRCKVYQYWGKFTGAPVTAEQVNQWNRENWLGTAYLGTDGAVRLVITQRVEGGTTKANIASVMGDWRAALKRFTGYIGFGKAGS
jgi:hypothetical protein